MNLDDPASQGRVGARQALLQQGHTGALAETQQPGTACGLMILRMAFSNDEVYEVLIDNRRECKGNAFAGRMYSIRFLLTVLISWLLLSYIPEENTPGKSPILLVHGLGGSAAVWRNYGIIDYFGTGSVWFYQ